MTEYTAETTNATNTVTATPADQIAQVSLDLNGNPMDNGIAASWEEGVNTLTITVINGGMSEIYTITVTKS